jgi:hypothetical protein
MRQRLLLVLLAGLALCTLTGPALAWYPSTPQVEMATSVT